ncbi:MAG TPA: hemerythrin family protein [Azospirillum sp.]|nr:hemerythrin family protein [Azospirillum sp.]
METVNWTDALLTGVDEIDAEHRYYFEILHRFNKARADGFDPRRVRTLLNDLLAYIEMHFRNEEAIMREAGYPAFERHVAIHQRAARTIQDTFATDPSDAQVHEFLNSFLSRWLINHIQSEDRAFGEWLEKSGKTP